MKVKVKEAITIAPLIRAVVNLGNNSLVENLNIDTAPQAKVRFFWGRNNPGQYVLPDATKNTVTFVNPNGANGDYVLTAIVTGDDGSEKKAVCNIEVYEAVYLVGVMKSYGRDIIYNGSDFKTAMYSCEVVAKWLAHPNSMRFPAGEVGYDIFPFYYNGVYYEKDHTEVLKEYKFNFYPSEGVQLAWNQGIYYGVPADYIEYYNLQTDNGGYHKHKDYGNIYVISRPFGGGFAKENVHWSVIFNYIYH